MKPNLKDLIKNNTVSFLEYRKGYLYYSIPAPLQEGQFFIRNYRFAIPPEDLHQATFKATDRAALFMRWIKKAIEENTLVEI